jgi:hypothetical protein
MSRFGRTSGIELHPSHSDHFSAATKNGNTLQYLPYTINRPSDVRTGEFAKFSQAVSEAVPEADVVLLNEDSIQMTWKHGKPARMLRFGDLPEAPTGKLHSLAVWGGCYEEEEQELTSTVLGFSDSCTQVYEDVDGRKDDLKMLFTTLEPSDNRRKTTRDPGSIVTKYGRGWMISTYTPKAGMDAASSKAPGTLSKPSTCTADGGEEGRGTVVAGDSS